MSGWLCCVGYSRIERGVQYLSLWAEIPTFYTLVVALDRCIHGLVRTLYFK